MVTINDEVPSFAGVVAINLKERRSGNIVKETGRLVNLAYNTNDVVRMYDAMVKAIDDTLELPKKQTRKRRTEDDKA